MLIKQGEPHCIKGRGGFFSPLKATHTICTNEFSLPRILQSMETEPEMEDRSLRVLVGKWVFRQLNRSRGSSWVSFSPALKTLGALWQAENLSSWELEVLGILGRPMLQDEGVASCSLPRSDHVPSPQLWGFCVP